MRGVKGRVACDGDVWCAGRGSCAEHSDRLVDQTASSIQRSKKCFVALLAVGEDANNARLRPRHWYSWVPKSELICCDVNQG